MAFLSNLFRYSTLLRSHSPPPPTQTHPRTVGTFVSSATQTAIFITSNKSVRASAFPYEGPFSELTGVSSANSGLKAISCCWNVPHAHDGSQTMTLVIKNQTQPVLIVVNFHLLFSLTVSAVFFISKQSVLLVSYNTGPLSGTSGLCTWLSWQRLVVRRLPRYPTVKMGIWHLLEHVKDRRPDVSITTWSSSWKVKENQQIASMAYKDTFTRCSKVYDISFVYALHEQRWSS